MSIPRLFLFGSPGAGKSALLGALAQAASTHPELLKGTLSEATGELAQLQKNTYQAKPAATDSTTEYHLRLQGENNGAAYEVTVIDGSGAEASAMLKSPEPFRSGQPLQKPLLNADTVMLVINVTQGKKTLVEELQHFARWLKDYQEARGWRTEVAELPVYLVLTKCDLLAKPNDSFSQWQQKIEDAKRWVRQKFREFYKEPGDGPGGGFGSIQLHVWATAIKRPAFADRPAQSEEPYGVAELFRQCLHAAADYEGRQQHSQSRLHNLFIAMIGLVALLLFALGFLFEYQPAAKHSTLEEKVQKALPKKESERFAGSVKNLEQKRKDLQTIQNNAEFEELPPESRVAVNRYAADLTQYLDWYNKSQNTLKPPHMAKNEEEYGLLKKSLDAFKLPEDRAKEWENTKLAARLEVLRKEFAQVEKAHKEEVQWYRTQTEENDRLETQGLAIVLKLRSKQPVGPQEVDLWRLAVREQLAAKSRKPRDQYIGITRMTYEDLDKFDSVQVNARRWQESLKLLQQDMTRIQEKLNPGT